MLLKRFNELSFDELRVAASSRLHCIFFSLAVAILMELSLKSYG